MGQAISSTQFFLYGKRHFTQSGYLRHVKQYYPQEKVQPSAGLVPIDAPDADGVNLHDKVIVVTGANSGLGKEVAMYAAAKGARVYMLCRSKDRAEQAKREIIEATKNSQIEIILVDVSELQQIRNAAIELQGKESSIHALVCNAGVLLHERTESSEGKEVTFVSHLLGGTYLLSKLLIPQLQAAHGGQGRVVIVTSGGMYNFKLPHWDLVSSAKTVEYNGVNAYAFAKRGQVILAEMWSKEYPTIPIVTVHPGWSDTPAVDDAFGDMKKYLHPLRTPWQGAEGVAWLIGTNTDQLQSGALYLDRKVQPKHIAGPFFTEGWYTKNTPEEMEEFMKKLQEAADL